MSANWNDVWAEYDARQPKRPDAAPRSRAGYPNEAEAPATRSASRFRWSALLIAPLLLAGWFSAPLATGWSLVQALDGRDSAGLAQHLDMAAMQSSVRDSLVLGSDAPQDGQAGAYLRAMARDITLAWSEVSALTEVVRARGVAPGAASEALRGTLPTGLTRFEMPLRGTLAPVALQLELTGEILAPRWQVTGVRLEPMTPVPTFAPGPMRFIAPR